jgi:hypothetical protein
MGSRGNSLGVTGEQGCVSDVLESQVEHNHSFEADSSTSVRVGSVFEAVDVVLDGLRVNSALLSSLLQDIGVMNPLGPTHNFLPSHKEVVGAGELWVVVTESRIESSG